MLRFAERYQIVFLTLLAALCAGGCHDRWPSETKSPVYPVADKPAVLAQVQGDEKPVIIASGLAYHAPVSNLVEYTFSELGGGVAFTIQKEGMTQVVHNGAVGKPYKTIGEVVLSPDGKHVAYGALVDGQWRMVVDGVEGAGFNTVKAPIYSPDSRHLVYQGMKADKWYLILDSKWNNGTEKRYLRPVFSGDVSTIVYVDNVDSDYRGRLVVADIGFKLARVLEENGVSNLDTNFTRTRVAAIQFTNGKRRVIDFSFARPTDIHKGELYDSIENLGFGSDGKSLGYLAERSGKKFVVLNGREEPLAEGDIVEGPLLRPDLKAAGSIMKFQNRFYYWQYFADAGKKGGDYDEISGLCFSSDSSKYAFAAQKENSWRIVVNGKEGPVFDRVVAPKFSPDGKFVVYRVRKEGKRFVVVADSAGDTVRQHPSYEQVFEVRFTADGKSVAYGVKDGKQLAWKVEPL